MGVKMMEESPLQASNAIETILNYLEGFAQCQEELYYLKDINLLGPRS
jgi:hypothetical protein